MTKKRVSKRKREQVKFERWIEKYWGGLACLETVPWVGEDFEYTETPIQVAWEVWMKFTGVKR